jgi:hypothetical protein
LLFQTMFINLSFSLPHNESLFTKARKIFHLSEKVRGQSSFLCSPSPPPLLPFAIERVRKIGKMALKNYDKLNSISDG